MDRTSPPSGWHDRALGALTGVALGDALGMPSQTLPRSRIAQAYGRVGDFLAPFDDHPVSHGLFAAQVTDDTEQTLLLARLMIAHPGGVDARLWARALLDWEAGVRARGLRDLLGPSSKAALDALLRGVPADRTGLTGTTNGAAMRIAPVGIATPPDDAADLAARVAEACRVTHATREAIAAASAVAMVISQGVAGRDFDGAIPAALNAAEAGTLLGAAVGEADMAGRIVAALAVAGQGEEALLAVTGNSVASRESIPAAFGIVRLARGDPWRAALIAANFGDDTDTIGSIACAMAGACGGISAFPPDKVARVMTANGLDLAPVVAGLLDLRALAEGRVTA
jgi:ADP-ribosylglycohydrolase